MTRTETADKIVARLFNRPKRPVQVSLLWLLIGTAVAPVLIYLVHLFGTSVCGGKHHSSCPRYRWNLSPSDIERLSETPLWSDSFAFVAGLSLAAAWISGIAMQFFDDHEVRYVASAIVCGCAMILLIACVLCFANGAGNATVLAAGGEDYFVVYLAPLALAIAVGTAIGGAIAVT